MDVDEITHHLGVELLGIVFDDDAVITTSNNGEPVVLQAENPAGQGYCDIARRLVGESVPLMEIRMKKSFHSGKRSVIGSTKDKSPWRETKLRLL